MKSKVIVAFSIWDSVKPKTFSECIMLATSGVFDGVVTSIGSLLPLSRNCAVRDVYDKCPDFTHLCFIDGDMSGLTTDIFEDLILADRDIITPVMTLRQPPYSPVCDKQHYPILFDELKKEQPNRKPFEVDHTGFGCALIKREVLDATMEVVDDGARVWFTCDRQPRKDFFKEVDAELLNILGQDFPEGADIKTILEMVYKKGVKKGLDAHIGSITYGEDYAFCSRAKKLGFKIFMHGGKYIHHIGDQEYNLNDYIDFLEYMNKGEEVTSRLQNARVSVWQKTGKKLLEIMHGEHST